MKKLGFTFAMILFMIMLAFSVCAKNGDVIGKVYSSDILALVNGIPVESYNIGGRTVILAEDLIDTRNYYYSSYGFDVRYDDKLRLLTITSYGKPIDGGKTVSRGKNGNIAGNVYETDIKVMFNGCEVKGYNIGGKTGICIEDLGEFDGSGNNLYGYSKYLARCTWNEKSRTVELITAWENREVFNEIRHFIYVFTDNVLTASHDQLNPYVSGSYMSQTEDFMEDLYSIKPLYFETGGEQYEIGICFAVKSDHYYNRVIYIITDTEQTKELLKSLETPKKTYDEAIEYLYNHPDYTTAERFDNDDYTVLIMSVKESEGLIIFAVKKTGGCLKLEDLTEYSDREVAIEFEENTVTVSIYPWAGPRGNVVTMYYIINLDEFPF